MDIPTDGVVPEFAIPARQYRLDDMRELVEHPEIQAETTDNFNTHLLLPAFVDLGHIAIEKGDNEAYNAWMTYTTEYVDSLQMRETGFLSEQYFGEVARLRFYGAIHGRTDMAEELHDTLAAATSKYSMNGLINLCAQHDINPGVWIERHAKNADERVHAWGSYLVQKQSQAEIAGRELTAQALREPGSERIVQDTLAGELSDTSVISWGRTVFSLADNPRDKKQVIDRYSLAISARDYESDADYASSDQSILEFAAHVMSDPDVTQDTKMDLYHQAMAEASDWPDVTLLQPTGLLEIAKAVNNGEDVQAVLGVLENVVKKNVAHPASRKLRYEYYTRAAADLYATHGDYQQSAAQLSRLDNVIDWQAGVEHFLRRGGDIHLVREADTMRRDFEAVLYAPDSPEYKAARWDLRPLITDFLEYTTQTPDAGKARAALFEVAQGGQTDLGFNRISLRVIEDLAARLLKLDPTAIEIGPELVQCMGWKTDFLKIYEIFARHGSKEMETAGWEYVNRQHVPDRAFYLLRYASMAVTALTVETT